VAQQVLDGGDQDSSEVADYKDVTGPVSAKTADYKAMAAVLQVVKVADGKSVARPCK
jgi:hypothetical protein